MWKSKRGTVALYDIQIWMRKKQAPYLVPINQGSPCWWGNLSSYSQAYQHHRPFSRNFGRNRSRPISFTSMIMKKESRLHVFVWPGAPRAKREPGDSVKIGPPYSSNMTDFQFCEVQNRRRKCRSLVRNMMWSQKKKVFTEMLTVFAVEFRWSSKKKVFRLHLLISQGHFDGPPEANGPMKGLPEAHGPRGHCPLYPPSRRPCVWRKSNTTRMFYTRTLAFSETGKPLIRLDCCCRERFKGWWCKAFAICWRELKHQWSHGAKDSGLGPSDWNTK